MQKKKTFSIVVVLALLVAIPILTGVLARKGFEFRIAALEDDTPRNIVISDVKDDSFKVNWITERNVIGGVVTSDGTKFLEDISTSFHSVTVMGLTASTDYSFKILSGSREFGREEGDYTVKTASVSTSEDEFLIWGQVFSADGYSFQQGGVIVLELSNLTVQSQTIAAIINETGGYTMNLGGMLSKELNRNFPYRTKADAVFKIYTSHAEEYIEKKYSVDFSINRQIQNIYLGDVNIDLLPAIEGD